MPIMLDNTPIVTPQVFEQEWYKITKAGRVASGKMTMELVCRKRKWVLSYTAITGDDLDVILNLVDADTTFYTLSYPLPNGETASATVYTGAIKGRFFRNAGTKLFTDVSFALIEQ